MPSLSVPMSVVDSSIKYTKVIDLYYEYISTLIHMLPTTNGNEFDELREHILTQIDNLKQLQQSDYR